VEVAREGPYDLVVLVESNVREGETGTMPSEPTRRQFLQAAALATAVASGFSRSARAVSPLGRTRPGHLKLSLAAYSYRKYLGAKPAQMDLFDFVNLAADMALDAVELTSYYFPADVDNDYLHRLKQHAFVLGLDVSGTSVGNDFCVPPGPLRDKQIELVRTWVDHAAELDAPVIRIFAGRVAKGDSEETAVARAIEGIKASLPYAAEKGVSLALENHGGITANPEQFLKLVRAIDAPNFGVNLDTGNFHTADPYADLAKIAPYAINVQLKTEINREGKSKEEADLKRLVDILRDARYSGYVVLEYEAADDPMTAVPRHIKTLRGLIGG
jgi:sugar phosphate isomerase/epimerase